jgi:hypothetical protein
MHDETIQLAFRLGEKVRPKLDSAIEAMVTAYCVRPNGPISFEISWIHSGEVKTGWFGAEFLEAAETPGPVGFRVKTRASTGEPVRGKEKT